MPVPIPYLTNNENKSKAAPIMYWLQSIMLQIYSQWTSHSMAIQQNNVQLFRTITQV